MWSKFNHVPPKFWGGEACVAHPVVTKVNRDYKATIPSSNKPKVNRTS